MKLCLDIFGYGGSFGGWSARTEIDKKAPTRLSKPQVQEMLPLRTSKQSQEEAMIICGASAYTLLKPGTYARKPIA
jgi:hypothetical protein